MQSGHEDDSGFVFQFQPYIFTTHELCQLVVHEFDHQLSRFHGSEHVHTEGLLLHSVREGLSHFIVHVGVDERTAHILHRLGDVDFCNFTLTLEDFERPFQAVTKIFKHVNVYVYLFLTKISCKDKHFWRMGKIIGPCFIKNYN